MIKIIRKLLGLCEHQWEIFQRVRLWDNSVSTSRPVGTKYHLQCKHCGDVKIKKDI
jgi:hypothetical protein